MPGVTSPAYRELYDRLASMERSIRALATQQQFVVSDPTQKEGDPAHGYATFVLGSLNAICGIAAYGAAKYAGGKWTQL